MNICHGKEEQENSLQTDMLFGFEPEDEISHIINASGISLKLTGDTRTALHISKWIDEMENTISGN